MSPSLYLAHRPRVAVPAMLIIVKGRGTGGLAFCRSALILAAGGAAPVLREFSGPAGADADAVDAPPDKRLHRLALGQAACDATDASGAVLPGDFERVAWSSLLRWALFGKVACETLTAVANHVGFMDGSGRLRTAAKILRRVVG